MKRLHCWRPEYLDTAVGRMIGGPGLQSAAGAHRSRHNRETCRHLTMGTAGAIPLPAKPVPQ